ncbi:hypothetical protein TTHERM_00420550 (macronuclear) [Tetrahymena thermophila SB210]|uniref:Uncharacterized protein n=1 Tax=Tetrahymena thermophila (strain SB210) TaxID=312017 RepID=I7MH05_TETTS|nr:hypothetical protein TTHERM_00420550 [Tetrahymena thermophila SB210]EAR85647.2 hypothetical protein TTHERM_00420550 [Tetrahymena thermophila SB210]|eukprot:XP_001033310.2 hypothetical protein TTHERM_00420550 [Tetrahymena thermophila SB210]
MSEKYSKEELDNYYEIYYEEWKQLEPISNGTSFALLNLIGVQIENIELFLRKCNSFMDPSGARRLDNILNMFEFINSGQDQLTIRFPIITIDQIIIESDTHMQYIKTDKIPEDLREVFKYQCVIQQFSIDIREIEKVIKLRGNELVRIYKELFEESIYIENTVMNEVFLEKYYPETFFKLKGLNINHNC